MVGGYDFESSEFNRATQAMRQVGSTFKPIVYSTAFEKGMTPESTVLDAPISFTDGLGRVWAPSNYDGKFKGQITIRQALTESRNMPTIRVASLIGIKNVVVMARRFGITSHAGTLSAAGDWRVRSYSSGNGVCLYGVSKSRNASQTILHPEGRRLRSRQKGREHAAEYTRS